MLYHSVCCASKRPCPAPRSVTTSEILCRQRLARVPPPQLCARANRGKCVRCLGARAGSSSSIARLHYACCDLNGWAPSSGSAFGGSSATWIAVWCRRRCTPNSSDRLPALKTVRELPADRHTVMCSMCNCGGGEKAVLLKSCLMCACACLLGGAGANRWSRADTFSTCTAGCSAQSATPTSPTYRWRGGDASLEGRAARFERTICAVHPSSEHHCRPATCGQHGGQERHSPTPLLSAAVSNTHFACSSPTSRGTGAPTTWRAHSKPPCRCRRAKEASCVKQRRPSQCAAPVESTAPGSIGGKIHGVWGTGSP